MGSKENAINEIVTRYFGEPDKSLEEIINEYASNFTQNDADEVFSIIKEIIN